MTGPTYSDSYSENAAEDYERYFVPAIGRPVAAALVDDAALAPGERVLDEGFDVVLCGMGLQFFSDREAGLREMRRVLVPGGRLLANLPGPTPPPLKAMAEALACHVSPESVSFVHAVFALHDADEIRALATDAGFDVVEVRSEPVALRLPPPADFLWQYVHSTPMAAVVAQVDEECRDALERDFSERCRDLVTDGALVGAVRMTTLTTRR